ncbi:MAG: FAD binding domain-containing protein [Sphingomonadaceae bacterium]
MTYWEEYHLPKTVEEALQLRATYVDDARFIAGGTDLILDLQYANHAPIRALIDVTAVSDLDGIRAEEGYLVIGAAATHASIESDPLLQEHAAALTESCRVVGGPQVRNVATIGGNVAHALPAADGTIGLLALDAEARVCTLTDQGVACVWQPLLSLFAGPGRNTLGSNQLLGAFRVAERGPRQASAFDRIMRPQGVALPILGVAARLTLDESCRRVTDASIAVGPAGPIPFRAGDAEALLADGALFDSALVEDAVAAAQSQAQLRTSRHRASKEYRHEMLAVLLRRVLERAFVRAAGGGQG